MGKTRHAPPTAEPVREPPTPFDLMMVEAKAMISLADQFHRNIRQTDGIFCACWRKGFGQLNTVIRMTLRIEKQKGDKV